MWLDPNCSFFQYRNPTIDVCYNCSDLCIHLDYCAQLCPEYLAYLHNSSQFTVTSPTGFNDSATLDISPEGNVNTYESTQIIVAVMITSLLVAQVALVILLVRVCICWPQRTPGRAIEEIELSDLGRNRKVSSKTQVGGRSYTEEETGFLSPKGRKTPGYTRTDGRHFVAKTPHHHNPVQEVDVSPAIIACSGRVESHRSDSGIWSDQDEAQKGRNKPSSSAEDSTPQKMPIPKKEQKPPSRTDIGVGTTGPLLSYSPGMTEPNFGITIRSSHNLSLSSEETRPKMIAYSEYSEQHSEPHSELPAIAELPAIEADGISDTLSTETSSHHFPQISLHETDHPMAYALPQPRCPQNDRPQDAQVFSVDLPHPVPEAGNLVEDRCPTSDFGAAAPKVRHRSTKERVENARIIAGLPYIESVIDDESLAVFVLLSRIKTLERAREDIASKTGLEPWEFNVLPWDEQDPRVVYSSCTGQISRRRSKELRGYIDTNDKKEGATSFILGALVSVNGITHMTAPAHAFNNTRMGAQKVYSSPCCRPKYVIGICMLRRMAIDVASSGDDCFDVDLALVKIRKKKLNWIMQTRYSGANQVSCHKFLEAQDWIGKKVQIMAKNKLIEAILGISFSKCHRKWTLKPSSEHSWALSRPGLSGSLVTLPRTSDVGEVTALTLVHGNTTYGGRVYILSSPLLESFQKLEQVYNCKIEEWDRSMLGGRAKSMLPLNN